jgi:hypothetical protein
LRSEDVRRVNYEIVGLGHPDTHKKHDPETRGCSPMDTVRQTRSLGSSKDGRPDQRSGSEVAFGASEWSRDGYADFAEFSRCMLTPSSNNVVR